MVKFKNREDALNKILVLLDGKLEEDFVILAISERAVFYATEISKKFQVFDADFMFSEILYAPNNKECGVGCVTETMDYVFIEELINSFDISRDFVFGEIKRLYDEKVISYMYQYRQGDQIIDLENKRVLLVDEGAVTGLTLEACVKSCINSKAKQIDVVMPIIPKSLATQIKKIADNCYFVYEIENFVETDFYFEDRKDKYEL